MEDEETIVAPGTSAWTAEPTQDLLPSSVEGSSGTGLSQPKTIREDAVNSPGANPIQEMLIADSAQTEYCTTFHFPSVRSCVTGVTSHISHIYKGINAMLIIRGPIKPYIF